VLAVRNSEENSDPNFPVPGRVVELILVQACPKREVVMTLHGEQSTSVHIRVLELDRDEQAKLAVFALG
jgi:hypothetical protein